MPHKFLIGAAVATVALGTAMAAGAATLVSPANGPDLSEMLHNNFSPDGNLITLKSDPTGYLVDALSPTTLHANGNGFSFVSGVTDGFDQLTLFPDPSSAPPFVGFSAIKFTLNLPNKDSDNNRLSNLSFDIDVNYLGTGSPLVFHVSDGQIPSNSKYEIDAGTSEIIKSITFIGLTGTANPNHGDPFLEGLNFDDIRQISFNAVTATTRGFTPEPATWGMMLLGFFGVGALLRRRAHVMAQA